ncbi:hypothetical protein JTB14_032723 [Gonioctena quinquepunctata]|nr:hypothetical protein JTB14_032723 [Gonioctena quinquepunctata]
MVVDKKYVSLIERVQWVCNTIYHQAVAVVTVFITYVIFKNLDTSNRMLWHMFLSTFAYVPLMAEGIILFSEPNVWSQRLDRTKKNYLHGILLGLSTISVTVGICFEIYSKNQRVGVKHFQSDHAITGLVSWVLSMVSVLLGLFAAYSNSLKKFIRPVILKFIHNFLGLSAFAIGVASLVLGLLLRIFTRLVTTNEKLATVWMVSIISVWSVLSAFVSLFNQIKTILT